MEFESGTGAVIVLGGAFELNLSVRVCVCVSSQNRLGATAPAQLS